jgi:hypothetical protein
MPLRRLRCFLLLSLAAPTLAFAASAKPCVSAEEASKLLNKDVCVNAHIYDVVELPNGMRFLDVCTPETADENCRFTVVSMFEDRTDVGELGKYKNANVHIRGIVQSMHGRAGMVLSHERQFNGGPPKFKPNPKLARGFNAEQDHPAINDPNLRSHGSHRAFMTTRDQVTRPAK